MRDNEEMGMKEWGVKCERRIGREVRDDEEMEMKEWGVKCERKENI